MDGVDLAKLWKEYVWQLDQLLPANSSCRGQWTPTRERLDALTSELVQLMMHLWDSCQDFARIKVLFLAVSNTGWPQALSEMSTSILTKYDRDECRL